MLSSFLNLLNIATGADLWPCLLLDSVIGGFHLFNGLDLIIAPSLKVKFTKWLSFSLFISHSQFYFCYIVTVVCQWFVKCQWFSPGILVSSNNKTDCYYITEILLKVALNTITIKSSTWLLCTTCLFPLLKRSHRCLFQDRHYCITIKHSRDHYNHHIYLNVFISMHRCTDGLLTMV